jgi:hypothetical protein
MVQSLTGLASEDDLKTISALRSKTVDEKTISASSTKALALKNCGRRGGRVSPHPLANLAVGLARVSRLVEPIDELAVEPDPDEAVLALGRRRLSRPKQL